MCTFFSFMVNGSGKIYAFLDRNEEGVDYDSHSYISEHYNIAEDEAWKFDLNFCGESLMDFSQMNVAQLDSFLREHYDGGLPLEEMPATIAHSVLDWLIANRDKIVSIGMETMGTGFFKSQLEKIISEFITSGEKKKVSLYKFPVAFSPEELPRRMNLHIDDQRVVVYINYTTNLVGYMGVALYVHPYVDNEGNIQTEYRANVQLFPIPQKIAK